VEEDALIAKLKVLGLDHPPAGASLTAFELLLDIDRRCRLLVADQPPQDNRLQQWSGIGFRIAGQWFVAPMGEVAEVLREPRSSRVPGVQPWVCGVANLRGRLLPVMDLSASSAWATPHRASSGGCWCWTTTTCSSGCWWTRCWACSTSPSTACSCRRRSL
jgi:twitching motility protein PilI